MPFPSTQLKCHPLQEVFPKQHSQLLSAHPGPSTSPLHCNCWFSHFPFSSGLCEFPGGRDQLVSFSSPGPSKATCSSGHPVDSCLIDQTAESFPFTEKDLREGPSPDHTAPRDQSWDQNPCVLAPRPSPAGHLGHGRFWTFTRSV